MEKQTQQQANDEQLFELYAPAVYGHILRITPQVPIADMILRKVFLDAFKKSRAQQSNLRSPLTTLLNNAREKTKHTMDALLILNECCAGCTVVAEDMDQ